MPTTFRRSGALTRALLGGVCAATLAVALVPSTASAQFSTCTDVELVFARGTTEPAGTGIIVGPLFSLFLGFSGLNTSTYAVNFPADLTADSSQIGNRDLVNHVVAQHGRCPQQKFVLGGYSQGANVVQMSLGVDADNIVVGAKSVAKLPDAVIPQIKALTLFGNPLRKANRASSGPVAADRVIDYCAAGDVICDPAGTESGPHFSYWTNTPEAASKTAALVKR